MQTASLPAPTQAGLTTVPPRQTGALAKAGIDGLLLTNDRLELLVSVSQLYWKVVGLVPQKARMATFKIDGADEEQTDTIMQLIRTWSADFAMAQRRADTIGTGSYAVLNTYGERGQVTAASRIFEGTVARLEIVAIKDCLTKEGDYYYYPPDILGNRAKVHKSRVLEFKPRFEGSIAQRFHSGMQIYKGALLSAIEKVINKDVTIVKKRGLDDDVAQSDDPQDYIRETLKPIAEARDKDGILLLDAKFDAEILGHTLTQIPDIVNTAREYAIACSGLTERLLFDYAHNGVTITGEDPDALFLADQVDSLVATSWTPKYAMMLRLLRANYDVELYPQTSYVLSATAQSGIMLNFARAAAVMMDYQVLLPEEVRTAWEGNFTSHIQLATDYTPPRVLNKHKKEGAKAKNQDKSRIAPNNRTEQQPRSGDFPSDPSEGQRASDESLKALLVDMGKSQPRLTTLHRIQDRAIADGENPMERLGQFLARWAGKATTCPDDDLIPDRKK